MKIRENFGNKIVCGYIFPIELLRVGTLWQSSSGSKVTIESIDYTDIGWIKFKDSNGDIWEKDNFCFQCRYCLVV